MRPVEAMDSVQGERDPSGRSVRSQEILWGEWCMGVDRRERNGYNFVADAMEFLENVSR